MTTTTRIDWKAIRADLAEAQEQPTTIGQSIPNETASSAPATRNGQRRSDTHAPTAVPGPTTVTSNGHPSSDTHDPTAVAGNGSTSEVSQTTSDTHTRTADLGSTSIRNGQSRSVTQMTDAVPDGSTSLPAHRTPDTHTSCSGQGPFLEDPFLAMAAEMVNEAEDSREKVAAHLRELLDPKIHNCSPEHPEVQVYNRLLDGVIASEKQAIANLERLMAAHPLGAWQKATTGIGSKQLGRLLGAIKDPYWKRTLDWSGNILEDRPRSPSELWSYTGFATDPDTGQHIRRKRGEKSNWSGEAKMRAHLLAKQQVKTVNSPYNPLYYATKEHYADAVHTYPCIQCGSKGKPAPAGTPLKPGHIHARALRAVAKEILMDLWKESQRLHAAAE